MVVFTIIVNITSGKIASSGGINSGVYSGNMLRLGNVGSVIPSAIMAFTSANPNKFVFSKMNANMVAATRFPSTLIPYSTGSAVLYSSIPMANNPKTISICQITLLISRVLISNFEA